MALISFKINGIQHEIDGKYGPDVSLNEYIRDVAGLPGTKVMCREGGCGVCVVAVRALYPPEYEMKTFSVNSCLVSVLSCQGWEITTVEGIGNKATGYHDIQTRLATFNGTQCGYCTPGWIMQMYSISESDNNLTSEKIENSFASNICRCTGYRSIVDAFKSFATDADEKLLNKITDLEDLANIKKCGVKCKTLCRHIKPKELDETDEEWSSIEIGETSKEMIVIDCGTHTWYKAYSLEDVFTAMANGDYKLVAGNTGQGVYHVTEYPHNVIDIFNVPELKGYIIDVNVILGAGMPLSEMMNVFQKLSMETEEFSYLQQLYDHMDLVAHVPVRNICVHVRLMELWDLNQNSLFNFQTFSPNIFPIGYRRLIVHTNSIGTIAGNLFLKYSNKEFQSDVFLLFETVGAIISIADSETNQMKMTLPEFLEVDMKGKVILSVTLPPMSKNDVLKTYKIMPRSQNAHAIINAGYLFKFQDNTSIIKEAKIIYGNISINFIHATKTEALLIDKDLYNNETLQEALKSLNEEVVPEERNCEPSPAFRKKLALALFYKAILSLGSPDKIDPKYKSGGEVFKRNTSKGTQTFDTDKSIWPLNKPIPKIESLAQCSGEATFANDLSIGVNDVYGAFVTANSLPGSIIENFDTSEAFKLSGVIAFYSAKDIPGLNSFIPKKFPLMNVEEEILCTDRVKFFGQAAGIIVAKREITAIKAAKLVKINYRSVSTAKALVTIPDVINSSESAQRVHTDGKIEPDDKGNNVHNTINGEFSMSGQYHFHMELQTTVAKPTENGMDVFSSTQWLDLTSTAIAECLNISVSSVNVIVRRLGGAYGGKISRATQIACAASLVCHLQGQPCRFILPLETNMQILGKRLPTTCKFEVGVSNEGEIQYLKNVYYQDVGSSINDNTTLGTLVHFRNCYDTRRWYVEGNSVLTDMPSNTYCRAPSSTEGIAMVEYIMEKIAFCLQKDTMEIRMLNMAKTNPIPVMVEQLKMQCSYEIRTAEIKMFNDQNRWRKRSLKLVPITYDLQYFAGFNSTVSIYHADGTVSITHGGIEMGQGLNTKVAQVCAYSLGIPLEKVNVKPSTSATSPNAMVTGGSIGSECVALATIKACEILNNRLEPIKKQMGNASFEEIIETAFNSGIYLQASYTYTASNTDLKPYNIYAVCSLEVEVDILTGNHEVRRVDLVEDTGRSLSPEIDVGQIEGAFVMGLGYWTSEQLIYDSTTGQLLTDRTWTYKPPGIKDIPADLRIYFRRNGNNEFGVLQSKATGEPALCLATVIIHAIREAVRYARLDAGYGDQWVEMVNPCTVENIFNAVGHEIEHYKLN